MSTKLLENKTFIEDIKKDLKGTLENIEKYETTTSDSEPTTPTSNSTVIIFHCEFSQIRGPRAFRMLRSQDRKINQFPNLSYPQIYVLESGYSQFHRDFPVKRFLKRRFF